MSSTSEKKSDSKVKDERGDQEKEQAEAAPEQPTEVKLYGSSPGTTILPLAVRDGDVEVTDGHALEPDADAKDKDTLLAGAQVEYLQGAVATNGCVIAINGEVFVFSSQMTAALKQVVDKAIVASAL